MEELAEDLLSKKGKTKVEIEPLSNETVDSVVPVTRQGAAILEQSYNCGISGSKGIITRNLGEIG